MKGFFSPSCSYLLAGTSPANLFAKSLDNVELSVEFVRHVTPLIDDWITVDNLNDEILIHQLQQQHLLNRCVSYSCALIEVLESELEKELIEQVEESITTVDANDVLRQLLLAPLLNPNQARTVASVALQNGFAATAHLFERLADFQPLLKRLANVWLSLPEELWTEVEFDKSVVWRTACSAGVILKSLEMSGARQFQISWNAILLHPGMKSSPKSRTNLIRIFQDLSDRLFPGSRKDSTAHVNSDEMEEPTRVSHKPFESAKTLLHRARTQIDSIVGRIFASDEYKAEIFLNELVNEQLQQNNGSAHAVKSLCNLAHKCADLFRTDWERRCLEWAHMLDPNDVRTLCQFADHLKRTGQFSEAIAFYQQARILGEEFHSVIGLADVVASTGDLNTAISKYKTIPNWEKDVLIRTAIADNLRRLGEVREAEEIYNALLSEGLAFERATAGLASISIKRGDTIKAESLFRKILQVQNLESRDRRVYKFALCGVLIASGKLLEAYQLADSLVRENPFFLVARIRRGEILGMLGRDDEALIDLPFDDAPKTFGLWVADYYKGILLLKLGRYREAERRLVAGLRLAIAQGNDRTIVRLGAAFAYLLNGNASFAEVELNEIRDFGDLHSKHLVNILKLHLAVLKENEQAISDISRYFDSFPSLEPAFRTVVNSLLLKDFVGAARGEYDLLLASMLEEVTAA